jgi:hypothetical protein
MLMAGLFGDPFEKLECFGDQLTVTVIVVVKAVFREGQIID